MQKVCLRKRHRVQKNAAGGGPALGPSGDSDGGVTLLTPTGRNRPNKTPLVQLCSSASELRCELSPATYVRGAFKSPLKNPASALLRLHTDWRISAGMGDAFLCLCLSWGFGLRRKLKYRCLLPLT